MLLVPAPTTKQPTRWKRCRPAAPSEQIALFMRRIVSRPSYDVSNPPTCRSMILLFQGRCSKNYSLHAKILLKFSHKRVGTY